MDLRHKKRPSFSGFTTAEVEKMERLVKDKDKQSLDTEEFCKKLARGFNHSKGRTGKSVVKWTEVQNWFQTQPPVGVSEEGAESEAAESTEIFRAVREACSGKKGTNVLEVEFEAKSSKDSAWYDVAYFVESRHLDSPDLAEVLVRFDKFKKDQDEWVKVNKDVRERSISLKPSECHLVEVGECASHYLKEGGAARYFDVKILGIEKKTHAVRSCTCIFTIRYIRDNSEKNVKLRSLYFRPSILDS